MGLAETKWMLRTFRITPNKLLGQNFMVEPSFYSKLIEYATINRGDVILDAGAGFGFLTKFLATKCKAVIAVEKDSRIVMALRKQIRGLTNVTVVEGDVLKAALPEFQKVVAIPPYYLSSRLITWLLERKAESSVLILQKEFANRFVASVGSEAYGWLTVIAAHDMKVELFDEVPKTLFYPRPEVDSVIVRLTPWETEPFNVNNTALFNRLVRWLFTQRNKKLGNALMSFFRCERQLCKTEAQKLSDAYSFSEKRTRDLTPREFGDLSNAVAQ